jgi:hypothetical protein
MTFEAIVNRKHIVCSYDGYVQKIARYASPFCGERLYLSGHGLAIESARIREMDYEDLRGPARDPYALFDRMKGRLEETPVEYEPGKTHVEPRGR